MAVDVELARAIDKVRTRIRNACAACKRAPSEVTIVAVSKTHPPELIRAAYTAGLRVFGENYVQEMAEKREALRDLPDLEWHFIGHLQRNKVKEVLPAVSVIETLDSVRLVNAVAQRAAAWPDPLRVLIQINLAEEPQKSGCRPAEFDALLAHARALPSLSVEGLMAVPPAGAREEELHDYFSRVRDLAKAHDLPVLSMGMSADLEIAIACGATHVRVGSAIFGERRLS